MSEWVTKHLGDVLQLNYGKSLPVKRRVNGPIPVFGSNGIVGTHKEAIVDRPGLLVGRKGSAGQVHRSTGPFCPIDTTFFITAEDAPDTDIEFLFYLLRHLDLTRITGDVGVPGLNREMAYREIVTFPVQIAEQKKIAHILSTVQRAIEAQERIIQTTTELKKALMHKLFTEGLHNERQKQTEIGPVPESWEVVRCEEVCRKISVGIVVRPSSYYVTQGVPAFRSQNVREDRIQPEPMVYISEESNDGPVKKSKLSAGDVLIVRTGYPGTSCVVPPEYDGANCIDLVFVRPDAARVRSHYLSRFFNSNAAKAQVQARKIGLAQQHFNVGAVKTTLMPLPSLDEQDEIISNLELIDTKHNNAIAKRTTLQALFRTLLHELMSAEIRVHNTASRTS